MPTQIVILGWGSLLWDTRPEFDDQHEPWQLDGPEIKVEFSRVSQTRRGALTLVIDAKNGAPCRVAYARSKRRDPEDAICDLRCREGTTRSNIGFFFADGSRQQSHDADALRSIDAWTKIKKFDVVVWTDLESNFDMVCGKPFAIDSALAHIQSLDKKAKSGAAEYVWHAPTFIDTPLRRALQTQPWFPKRRLKPPLMDWGFIAHKTERFFRGLQFVLDAPVRACWNRWERTRWSENEEKARTIQRDRYTVLWWFIETALAVWAVVSFPQPSSIATVIIWVLSVLRIVDIVQLNVNKTVFDSLRAGVDYQQASTVRSLILAVLNYFELLVCFGVLYCLCPSFLVDTAPQTRPPITDAADAFYFSVVTQLTVGYGDIVPRGIGKLVAAVQAILGFGFALIILGRVVSVLPPITGMADKKVDRGQ